MCEVRLTLPRNASVDAILEEAAKFFELEARCLREKRSPEVLEFVKRLSTLRTDDVVIFKAPTFEVRAA